MKQHTSYGVLKIGRSTEVPVADLESASLAYQQARDESGEGASTFPDGVVKMAGKTYHISYNGRVWDGKNRPGKSSNLILEAQRCAS